MSLRHLNMTDYHAGRQWICLGDNRCFHWFACRRLCILLLHAIWAWLMAARALCAGQAAFNDFYSKELLRVFCANDYS